MDIDLKRWDAATAEDREALAVSVARALDDFEFVGLETFELGDQARQVALFESDAGTFALVPGGPAKLGFDPSRDWTPTDLEAASWLETAKEWADGEAIEAFVRRSTTPVRQVEIAPMLVETTPFEPGWMPVDTEDEAVQRALEDHASVGTVELHRDDGVLRIDDDIERHPPAGERRERERDADARGHGPRARAGAR